METIMGLQELDHATRSRMRRWLAPGQRWRAGVLTWSIAVVALLGIGLLLYPSTAQWMSSLNQSKLVIGYAEELKTVDPNPAIQLTRAHAYNDQLTAGVDLLANANVPEGVGELADDSFDYEEMLKADDDGLMARLKYTEAQIDIPVYHGTSEETLLKGAGHLEGSHLPVGGTSTHAVITGHRGLADKTMFTHLDAAAPGDRFTIEVFGEVLTYEVSEVRVVEPEDTDSLRAVQGEDLVTLITCTPLGINTHRILVTGHRVTPTPIEDIRQAGAAPEIPGFPWWSVALIGGLGTVAVFVWRSGYKDGRLVRQRERAPGQGRDR